jgi:hypothetical protein
MPSRHPPGNRLAEVFHFGELACRMRNAGSAYSRGASREAEWH